MMNNKWNWTVKTLPRGKGRDFCVGDIHGTFDLLKSALASVGFDPKVDRLFSVGDLVDRGPYSAEAIDFLREPWFYAVRGNHEQILLDLYEDGEPNPYMLEFNVTHNGLGWWKHIPQAHRVAILEAFARMPIAMEVETVRGTVGFVHAEVPIGMDWQTFKADLLAGDPLTIESALWGRNRVKWGDTSGVPGVGRVFVGHTPQLGGPLRLGNVFILDTAAVYGHAGKHPNGKLSVANLTVGTQMLRSPRRLPLIDIYAEGVDDRPFGAYA